MLARMFHTVTDFGPLIPIRSLARNAVGFGARFLVGGANLDGLPPTPVVVIVHGDGTQPGLSGGKRCAAVTNACW